MLTRPRMVSAGVGNGDISDPISRDLRLVTLLQINRRSGLIPTEKVPPPGHFLPAVKSSLMLKQFLTLTVMELAYLAQMLFKIEENIGDKLHKSAAIEPWHC